MLRHNLTYSRLEKTEVPTAPGSPQRGNPNFRVHGHPVEVDEVGEAPTVEAAMNHQNHTAGCH